MPLARRIFLKFFYETIPPTQLPWVLRIQLNFQRIYQSTHLKLIIMSKCLWIRTSIVLFLFSSTLLFPLFPSSYTFFWEIPPYFFPCPPLIYRSQKLFSWHNRGPFFIRPVLHIRTCCSSAVSEHWEPDNRERNPDNRKRKKVNTKKINQLSQLQLVLSTHDS